MSSSASTPSLLCLPTLVERSSRFLGQQQRLILTTWSMTTSPKTTNEIVAEPDTHTVTRLLRLRCQCTLHHQQRHSQKRAQPDRSAPVTPSLIDEAALMSKTSPKKAHLHTCASRHYRQHYLYLRLSQKTALTSMVLKTAWTPQKQILRRNQMQSL
jgi:hypothetical protein